MASVLNVYNALKNLSNKEQKGFITPNVFNSFAPIAQMNVYNEMFRDFTSAKQQNRASLDPGRHRSPRKMTAEDLSIYIRDQRLSASNGNIYSKPSDLGKVVSIRVDGEDRGSGSDRVMCEMVYDVEKMNAILGSNLSPPPTSSQWLSFHRTLRFSQTPLAACTSRTTPCPRHTTTARTRFQSSTLRFTSCRTSLSRLPRKTS